MIQLVALHNTQSKQYSVHSTLCVRKPATWVTTSVYCKYLILDHVHRRRILLLYIQFNPNIIDFLKHGPFSNKTGKVRIHVTVRRVRVTILAVEKQYVLRYMFWVCDCSLSYLACKLRAPYYVAVCGLFGSIIFSTLTQKRRDFWKKKKLPNMKRVFWFFVQILFVIRNSYNKTGGPR